MAAGVRSVAAGWPVSREMMVQRMSASAGLPVEDRQVKVGGVRRSRSCFSFMRTVRRRGVVQSGTRMLPARVSPAGLSTSTSRAR